jgi:hypothetical protein
LDASTPDAAADSTVDGPIDGAPLADRGGVPISDGASDGAVATVAVPDIPHSGKVIYASPTGSDSNPGTLPAPVQTIAHAAVLAGSNGDVVLLDGVYDGSTQSAFVGANGPLLLMNGITLRAQNPRKATLRGQGGAGLELGGLNAVLDLQFENFIVGVRQRGGALLASGLTFSNVGYGVAGTPAALQILQSAVARLEPGGVTNYVVPPSGTFALVDENAQLEVRGGAIQGTVLDPLGVQPGFDDVILAVSSGAELVLTGVTVGPSTRPYGLVVGQATARLQSGTRITGCDTALSAYGVVVIDSSSLTGNRLGYVAQGTNPRSPTELTLTNASIMGNTGDGVTTQGGLQLDAVASQISNNQGSGIVLSQTTVATFSDTSIVGNGVSGLSTEAAAGMAYTITMRSSHVTGNGLFGVAVRTAGFNSGIVDLGMTEDGGNVFQQNGSAPPPDAGYVAGANVFASGWYVAATGNTWDPNVQGADAQGRYHAGDAALTYSTMDLPSGKNVLLGTGGFISLARAGQ